MEEVDCVVAGAGVVGLAVARALAMAGREVIILDAAEGIGCFAGNLISCAVLPCASIKKRSRSGAVTSRSLGARFAVTVSCNCIEWLCASMLIGST